MKSAGGLVIGAFVLLLAIWLLWVVQTAIDIGAGPRLAEQAFAGLPATGVSNPVTAVLLSYRGYDTLLELAVLLAALLGIWSLGAASPGFQAAGAVLQGMVTLVVPLLILAGGYLLWVGGHAPGGAFQAGALLGAAGVVMRLAGDERAGLPPLAAQRWLVVAGVAVFVLVGIATMGLGAGFLAYPIGWSKWLILAIETAATVAIGTTLAAAYVGGRPWSHADVSGQS
ncbi:sodium:proton antiporter [Thiorhodococcus mannitoliphagus]|uniref:Sodium:proton antiporter n=1 Tax=Thiorhodococcus mannitoliphagus TaxID=329406 RepID=A0A6P1DP33_9GAMM|nr:MnhB domain-containing protein [Thiorhodococcus mannitoliphagus]NEX18963.1 sodium:proton antiporter [Thiorhodococcus mannitoliphagus]